MKLKDVKRKADAIGVNKGMECCGGLHSQHQELPLTVVHMKNVSLREALNEISRAYKHAVWVYSDSTCNGKQEIILSFAVQ